MKLRIIALAGVAAALAGLAGAMPAQAGGDLIVKRDGRDVIVPVHTRTSGEALLDLEVAAPGTDWAVAGRESAVVSVFVDNRYATDVVVTGDQPLTQPFGLGRLSRGGHTVKLRFADDRSAAAARQVVVSDFGVRTYAPTDPEYLALKYAPIVYGRDLPELGDANQNARSDTPLLAWHEVGTTSVPGEKRFTYSVIWSNEDGGTNSPALMARWGRTTDIEWIYAVTVDARGRRVPGSDAYQAPNHETLQFKGRYDGDHATLETCTSNNNMCDVVDNEMRFFPSVLGTLPAGKAREYVMDQNPWSYLVMAKELIREGKVEAPSDQTATTPEVSDQRNYLYTVVEKQTSDANTGPNWVGVALGAKLKSGETVYWSNHADPTWSIQRDVPAATTIELPAGTTAADVESISAKRVVVGTDTGASVSVRGLQRGFLLGEDYLPGESFVTWSGNVQLTAAAPTAVVWQAGS
jgi:hypothetical protein